MAKVYNHSGGNLDEDIDQYGLIFVAMVQAVKQTDEEIKQQGYHLFRDLNSNKIFSPGTLAVFQAHRRSLPLERGIWSSPALQDLPKNIPKRVNKGSDMDSYAGGTSTGTSVVMGALAPPPPPESCVVQFMKLVIRTFGIARIKAVGVCIAAQFIPLLCLSLPASRLRQRGGESNCKLPFEGFLVISSLFLLFNTNIALFWYYYAAPRAPKAGFLIAPMLLGLGAFHLLMMFITFALMCAASVDDCCMGVADSCHQKYGVNYEPERADYVSDDVYFSGTPTMYPTDFPTFPPTPAPGVTEAIVPAWITFFIMLCYDASISGYAYRWLIQNSRKAYATGVAMEKAEARAKALADKGAAIHPEGETSDVPAEAEAGAAATAPEEQQAEVAPEAGAPEAKAATEAKAAAEAKGATGGAVEEKIVSAEQKA
eukprot:CAMPEP_0118861262 /NCGR_PEP_ID=MMETSP1163-20130328/6822_1 /TAXON_ID=124430 /ORGANISM="Phaeomonas parva, Strain CCMP2877" /LENGTH=426 /DNA_ID=CAMNT_0006795061 /DNA_START=15 /DNA_END=1295 /DNA_ORIENTATION=-